MAAKDLPWYQYWNALFQYNLLENSGWVNLAFKELVNFVPVQSPYEMQWWRSDFDYDRMRQSWDMWQFYMDKRFWVTERDNFWSWVIVTDKIIFEWNEYVMFKKQVVPFEDNWVIWIKKYNTSIDILCWTYNDKYACWIEWCMLVTQPTTECWYDKFIKLMGPKWPVTSWYQVEIRNTTIWWSVVGEVRLLNGWSVPGSVIYIANSPDTSVASGIMRLKWYDQNNTTYVSSTWILPESDKRYPATAVFAEDYWTVLGFVDKDWIQILPDANCNVAWSFADTIPVGSIFGTKYPITSVAKWWDWTAFLTGWSIFFSQWWFNLWAYTYSIDIWTEYTHLIKMQQYIVAIWPQTMWVVYKASLDAKWVIIPKFEEVTNEIGYFNPYSWQNRFRTGDDSFFLFNSDSELWKYDIQVFADNLWWVEFKLTGQELWRHYVNTTLKQLRREKWDHVEMNDDGSGLQIFITDWNNFEERDTIIINFSEKYKFWHKRHFCNITLRNKHGNTYYGNKLRCYGSDTDNWEQIKQYALMTFGDSTIRTSKNIVNIWILLWYNSLITKENTTIWMRLDLWWRSVPYRIDQLHWIKYLQELALIRYNQTDGKLKETTPYWMWIYGGNGISSNRNTINRDKDIKVFCWYMNSWVESLDDSCFDKHKELLDETWCDVSAIENPFLYWDSDFNFYSEVAKFWRWYMKINQPCDLITIEVISKDWDRLHFWWITIWYELIDTELTPHHNVVVFEWKSYWKSKNSC